MKHTIRIPISRYGYLESKGTDVKELMKVYEEYGDQPLTKRNGSYLKIKSMTGEHIMYNDVAHKYKTLDGEELIGGSTFAKEFKKEFPRDKIAGNIAKKHGVDKEDIIKQWEMSGKVARDFGTAVHQALEYHFLFRENPYYKLPKHPVLTHIITQLPVSATDNRVIPEALVSNTARHMAGQVDLVEITGKKKCIMHDWKNSGDIKKDMDSYSIQINYYAKILEFAGWTVEERIIWNYDGKWHKYVIEKMDLTNLEKKEVNI